MMALNESYWPADTSVPVLRLTVGDLLREAAAEVPDKLAVVSVAPGRDARTWTYAALLDDAERAAAWLLDRFRSGEHIAVWAPNVPEWIVLQYGAALAGLVLVTANPALRAAELTYALEKSHAVGVFHVDELRGSDMASLVRSVVPQLSELREAVSFEGWLDEVRHTPKRSDLPEVDPESATQIQFTSGTTGHPKAAVLKHLAMVTNAAYVRDRCGVAAGSTFVTALPLFHTAGCGLAGMGCFYDRATLVIGEVFDPGTLLAAIQEHRAEVFGGVPAMLHGLLAHPDVASFDLSSLQVVMSGGDLVPPALVEAWTQLCGASASAVYGQTELSPIVCQTRPTDNREDNLFTAGQPLPNVDVAILDPRTGQVQPVGHEGEICARGYQQMIGYLDMPEETARTVDAQGWLHTGDLGSMDKRGFVTVSGRLKDMIIRGGENIYPREIEEALASHPAMAGAVVIGLPDEAWGETVAAVVQLRPGGRLLRPTNCTPSSVSALPRTRRPRPGSSPVTSRSTLWASSRSSGSRTRSVPVSCRSCDRSRMSGLPRKEQWARTRGTLLDATMRCLVSHGYAGTTTQRIQDEAGVSRGALLHHFGSKSELLVAAIHHIADLRLRQFTGLVADLDDGPDALEQMVAAIRSVMTGPPFQAAIELWTASRTDEHLREALLPAERRLGRALREIFDAHAGIEDPDLARTAFESLMALVRGLELTRLMREDQSLADKVVRDWLENANRFRSA